MSKSGGVGFCGLLTIAFIILKLCDVIDWSWLWVLAPLWIPTVLVIGFWLICVVFYAAIIGLIGLCSSRR